MIKGVILEGAPIIENLHQFIVFVMMRAPVDLKTLHCLCVLMKILKLWWYSSGNISLCVCVLVEEKSRRPDAVPCACEHSHSKLGDWNLFSGDDPFVVASSFPLSELNHFHF